jgi:hypothetical protein
MAPLSTQQSEESPWEKRFWLEKAQRIALYGEVLDEAKQAELAASKSKEEIVDLLIADPRFSDAVLDFNYYFLNLKVNRIYRSKENGLKDYFLFEKATPALASARAFARNEDYFKLFDYKQPYLYKGNVGICKETSTSEALECKEWFEETAPTEEVTEAKKKWAELSIATYRTAINEIETLPDDVDFAKISTIIEDAVANYTVFQQFLGFGFADNPSSILSNIITLDLVPISIDQDQGNSGKREVLKILQKHLPIIEKLNKEIIFDPGMVYSPIPDISQLRELDLGKYDFDAGNSYFDFSFWLNFQNSSTNFNRRRGAYILKTYFCDDLKPLDVALPSDHTKGKHGSDPSCASCHYKLDPMAGFFRNQGLFAFGDFSKRPFIIFDDQKFLNQADKDIYFSSWKNPPNSKHVWNVGYIRSARDENLNEYGESLENLIDIIKTAPEVKQCLTRRMAEYFLGRDQVFDGGWLRDLSQKFVDASKSDSPDASTVAFKQVAKELLLSKTFSTRNPDPSKCYDFKKGSEPTAVPCEVAFNIENNCASCHKGSGAAKGLDLTIWTSDESGKGVFSHRDESGKQLPAEASFNRILESLSTQDEKKLMPYFKSMAPVERAQLFKWVEGELKRP